MACVMDLVKPGIRKRLETDRNKANSKLYHQNRMIGKGTSNRLYGWREDLVGDGNSKDHDGDEARRERVGREDWNWWAI